MSAHISGKTVTAKRVRYDGRVLEEKGEKEVSERADNLRDQGSGSQDATRDLVLQRNILIQRDILRAAAGCFILLFLLLAVRITGMALHYHSVNNELQTNYTTLTWQRDQLKTRHNNITLERKQLKTRYVNLTQQKERLEIEKIHLKKEKAG